MKRMIDSVILLRDKSLDYSMKAKGISHLGYPETSFNQIFNTATIVAEVLDYYYYIWSKEYKMPPLMIEELREDNAEKILEITKWAFIQSMSVIEFNMKRLLRELNNPLLKPKPGEKPALKNIRLSQIIEESRKTKLISETYYPTWDCAIKVRNALVHNNAIADRVMSYEVGGQRIEFIEGKTLKGNMSIFMSLIHSVTDAHFDWIVRLYENERFPTS